MVKEIKTITVETIVQAPMEKVWEFWTEPEHIVQWAFASDDWEAPTAENDGPRRWKIQDRDGGKGQEFQF